MGQSSCSDLCHSGNPSDRIRTDKTPVPVPTVSRKTKVPAGLATSERSQLLSPTGKCSGHAAPASPDSHRSEPEHVKRLREDLRLKEEALQQVRQEFNDHGAFVDMMNRQAEALREVAVVVAELCSADKDHRGSSLQGAAPEPPDGVIEETVCPPADLPLEDLAQTVIEPPEDLCVDYFGAAVQATCQQADDSQRIFLDLDVPMSISSQLRRTKAGDTDGIANEIVTGALRMALMSTSSFHNGLQRRCCSSAGRRDPGQVCPAEAESWCATPSHCSNWQPSGTCGSSPCPSSIGCGTDSTAPNARDKFGRTVGDLSQGRQRSANSRFALPAEDSSTVAWRRVDYAHVQAARKLAVRPKSSSARSRNRNVAKAK